jgi:hypothetical protein
MKKGSQEKVKSRKKKGGRMQVEKKSLQGRLFTVCNILVHTLSRTLQGKKELYL